jgi:hypothetical protein
MNFIHIKKSTYSALTAAFLVVAVTLTLFLVLEPTVGRSAVDTFKVTQTVTDETAFIVTANDVTMSPSLAGLTGGTAAGTTSVRVRTNNATGYTMSIAFSSSTAMGRNGGGGVIANYAPAAVNVPDFTFTNEAFSQFAYTVIASTSADLNTSFRDTGAACNAGAGNISNSCWLNPSTTAKTIITTSAPSLSSGSTSTVAFRVNIPNNPTPSVAEGTYVATATLTAVNN